MKLSKKIYGDAQLSPAIPAWLLVNGFFFYLIALYYLNIPTSKSTSFIFFGVTSFWLISSLILAKPPRRFSASDMFFLLYVLVLLSWIGAEFILGKELPEFLRYLPFFVILPYVAGRFFNAADIRLFIGTIIFFMVLAIPLVWLQSLSIRDLGSHTWNQGFQTWFFGYPHGSLLAGNAIALGQVALVAMLLELSPTTKQSRWVSVGLIVIGFSAALLTITNARGFLLASLMVNAILLISAKSCDRRLRVLKSATIIFPTLLAIAASPSTRDFMAFGMHGAMAEFQQPYPLNPINEQKPQPEIAVASNDKCAMLFGDATHQGNSASARVSLWFDSFHIILHAPFLGVGPGQFKQYSCTSYPHSTILHVFSELGLLGAIPFLCLMVFTVTNLRKKPQLSSLEKGTLPLLAIFILTCLTDQIYGNYFQAGMFFLLCGIGADFFKNASERKKMDFPKITVVTPSFNQGMYLERTIRSVLDQNYPNLEYIIVDGGSTDNSVEIIRRYADRLAWWVSEPDKGQTDAINKGLRRATGEWVAWQNSDDIYYPGVFDDVATTAAKHPDVGLIIGNMMLIDKNDRIYRDICYVKPTYNGLLAEGMVLTNQSAFWRRKVHEEIGFMAEDLHYSFDYEWFLRLTKHVKAAHVNRIWGALRLYGETKTSLNAQRFQEENQKILAGHEISLWKKRFFKLRRIILMLGNGQFRYVLRGIIYRVGGQKRGFC